MKKLLLIPLLLASITSVFAKVHTRDAKRHQIVMEKIKKQDTYDILFLGDSITHLMDEPKHLNKKWLKHSGKNFEYKAKELDGRTFLNAGISGEETTHLISRLEDGISKVKSKYTVIMIGTNDTRRKTSAKQVANNIKKSINLIQKGNPDTQIILYAIFPRGASDQDKKHLKNVEVNKILATFPDKIKNLKFVDINKELLGKDKKVTKKVFYDLLHPTLEGYKIWLESIKEETQPVEAEVKKAA